MANDCSTLTVMQRIASGLGNTLNFVNSAEEQDKIIIVFKGAGT